MTKPFDGSIIGAFQGREHERGNVLRHVVGVENATRVRGLHEAVVVLGGQEHGLALAVAGISTGPLNAASTTSPDRLLKSVNEKLAMTDPEASKGAGEQA